LKHPFIEATDSAVTYTQLVFCSYAQRRANLPGYSRSHMQRNTSIGNHRYGWPVRFSDLL